MNPFAITIGLGKEGGYADGQSTSDSDMYEKIGEALKMAVEAAQKGDLREAGEYLCAAIDLKE